MARVAARVRVGVTLVLVKVVYARSCCLHPQVAHQPHVVGSHAQVSRAGFWRPGLYLVRGRGRVGIEERLGLGLGLGSGVGVGLGLGVGVGGVAG